MSNYCLDKWVHLTDPWGQRCYTFPNDAKAAFNAAANVWGNLLQSSVPITISSCWADLGSSSTLGYSGGGRLYRNFTNAPRANTWYSSSLANSLAGSDLGPSYFDMHITYNRNFSWYYGTDGNTPPSQHDLMSVVLHEIAHGLNFAGTAGYSGGTGSLGSSGSPGIYDTFIKDGAGTLLTNYSSPSTALGNALTSNDLWFHGTNAMAANGGGRVKIYAPSTWVGGSSYSHLDYDTFNNTSNQLMVFAISPGESIHDPGPVTKGLLNDLGWTIPSDTTRPETTITGGPSGTITTRNVTFTYTGTDNVTPSGSLVYATYLQGYDSGWSSFNSSTTKSYTNLPNGTYTFQVKAKDEAGNVDPSPDTRSFTVNVTIQDTTPPNTSITGGPSGTITYNNPTFTYTGSDNVTPTSSLIYATYLQGYDSGWSGFSSSTSRSYSNLPNGSYTFQVKAKDQAENVDPSPDTRSFTVNVTIQDTTPPNTSITGGPSGTITYNNPTFTYTGSDNVTPTSSLIYATYLQGYDSGWSGFSSSTSRSYSNLANGSYTFQVKAKDQAENIDPSPDTRSFTVNAGPPLVGQWTFVNPPYVSSDWFLYSVNFTSSNEGWAVGGGGSNRSGVLLHYSGGSWTSVSPPNVSSSWILNDVNFTSSSEGWAVGDDTSNNRGVLLHYSGGSWTSVFPPNVSSSWWLYGVHFTSSSEGWAVGADGSNSRGVLLHYSGGSWTSVSPPNLNSVWALYGVHFTSSNEGWAVGVDILNARGVLLHYSGGSWTSVSPPNVSSVWWLQDVHFTSPNEGWAVGADGSNGRGVLLHYSGGSWTSVSPPNVSSDWSLNGVHFTSSNEGWAVGEDFSNNNIDGPDRGVLLHYSEGSWTSVSPPNVSSSWSLVGVHFTSPNEGWAVGMDYSNHRGVLLKYNSPLPDLTGKWDSLTQTCKNTPQGNKCNLKSKFTIQNIGNKDASSSTIKFYLSDNNTYNGGDTLLKQASIGTITAGSSLTGNIKLNLPTGQSASGKYVIAVIDADNTIAESNENNNQVVYGPIP